MNILDFGETVEPPPSIQLSWYHSLLCMIQDGDTRASELMRLMIVDADREAKKTSNAAYFLY